MTYPVVDVSGWEPVNPEPVGREAKVWLRPPGTGPFTGEHDWLFKPVVVPSNGHRQGEDWAEKIVSELAGTLGVPCAEVELAVRAGVGGSISRNVAPDGWSLVLDARPRPGGPPLVGLPRGCCVRSGFVREMLRLNRERLLDVR